MKIAYLASLPSESSGVVIKVNRQVAEWIKGGHEVKVFRIVSEGRKGKSRILNVLSWFQSYLKKGKSIARDVELFSPDICYCRYFLWNPYLIKCVSRYRSILEINSDDKTEYKKSPKWVFLYNSITRALVYSAFSGFVGVTNELLNKAGCSKPNSLCLGNGTYPVEGYINELNNEKPIVGFIGTSNAYWHGIGDIISFATSHPEFQFEVVGQFPAVDLPNVKLHGSVTEEVATSIVSKWDVAISTMGLYLKEMEDACPLKSRQYLSLGIPFVYSYNDPDLDPEFPFLLKLPNREKSILEFGDQVVAFILAAKGNYLWRSEIYNLSKGLTISLKEKERLAFFQTVCR